MLGICRIPSSPGLMLLIGCILLHTVAIIKVDGHTEHLFDSGVILICRLCYNN